MRPLLLFCLLTTSTVLFSQTKKVLLEEFTGVQCGICPNGAYYTDSMLQSHPNLIAVAVHTYSMMDAMAYPTIDTLGIAFAQGAPLGAVDRVCATPPSTNTGVYINQWDAKISQQEQQPASLTVSVVPTWNSATRLITASVTVNILANLPAGDYRVLMYVVEDSVVGTGAGYDQHNSFNQQVGSQWYGLGDPIVGYVHRHVGRALLPGAWGRVGVIPASPTTGQTFNTSFTYTLPASYNENHVHLVAFVSEVSSDHASDEVLNAEEVSLMGPVGIAETSPVNYTLQSSNGVYSISSINFFGNFEILDLTGRVITSGKLVKGETKILMMVGNADGIYILRLDDGESTIAEKFIYQPF